MTDKKSTMNRIQTGKWGENYAISLLIAKGYSIIAQNFRTNYGEIDIIAEKDSELVFVEVKTRTNRAYGLPEDSITSIKRNHLEATAQVYLQEHLEFTGPWRIDVIAIEKKRDQADPEVEWFENAI